MRGTVVYNTTPAWKLGNSHSKLTGNGGLLSLWYL